MELIYKISGDEVLVEFKGDMDTPASVDVQQRVDELLALASKSITIDCSKLAYIASSGLRHMISILKRCNAEGGHLTLININPDVMEIFKVTNFDRVFDIR